jgi:hypothetical protein
MLTRGVVLLLLAAGGLLLLAAGGRLAAPGTARAQTVDMERTLVERFGLSPAEIGQLRGGQVVVRTIPAEGREIAVGGAVRIPDDRERLVRWLRDISGFRKAADLGLARRLGSPPAINDFGDLVLDAKELAELAKCQPGDCGLRVGDPAIARFRADVDWAASDAGRRANLIARQLFLGYAEAYLRGGDEALGAAHNERKPRLVADEFRTLIRSAANLRALAAPLATYLERFPRVSDSSVEQFLYWAKGGVGSDPSITLHQLVIQREPGGSVYVADKQLYASRYTDAALLVLWLGTPPDGQGYYLVASMRARSSLLEGMTARLLRGRIEEESHEYVRIYLDWLRKSLTPG